MVKFMGVEYTDLDHDQERFVSSFDNFRRTIMGYGFQNINCTTIDQEISAVQFAGKIIDSLGHTSFGQAYNVILTEMWAKLQLILMQLETKRFCMRVGE